MKNRWFIVLSAIGIHISIGSVYAYSVMANPVKDILGVDRSSVNWAFKLAILSLGISAAFLGKWVEKVGPRKSGITAGILYGTGILGCGLSIYTQSLMLFYLFYGIIGGIGLGIGYITPVSTLVRWFPDKKGLATGMAIMGFGFSALIFGPLMQVLFESIGVVNSFYVLGTIYIVLIIVSSLYIEKPPEGYIPEGYKEKITKKTINSSYADITANQAFKTKRFYYILIMMFINISCGIAIIASASPMMQEKLNYTAIQAAAIVGFIGVFNGLGRIFWSSLSDYLGRVNVYIFFFVFQTIAFFFLPKLSTEILFLLTLFTILTMYGGGFALLPAFLGDIFGTKQLGAIHGMILIAWGVAGVVGPTIYEVLMKKTGSLDDTLMVFSGLFIIALITSVLMKLSIKRDAKKFT
ncbi:MAG TPA: MFS transporter [Flavobacteriaceae bacterium]|nr:MFS transporter [Flavobacteriaceae bacterium]HBS11538.1 MFS transporter [Flavobacteriaceae bacterium]